MRVIELAWGARTDIGRRRSRNEDAFLAHERVFAVADGMGGHARGDLAAAMAVDGLSTLAASTFARSDLLDAIRRTHEAIGLVAAGGEQGEMGTTLCGLAIPGEAGQSSLLVFNVGDSRVYRLRAGALEQMTHDHSVVQELIDQGVIPPAAAPTHPERHVVTRSLGSGERLDIDWWATEAVTGDRFLLCSDGLVKELDSAALAGALSGGRSPQELADDLVERALLAGGRDNVTVVVVEVVAVPAADLTGALGSTTNPRAVDAPTAPIEGRTPPGPEVVATGTPARSAIPAAATPPTLRGLR